MKRFCALIVLLAASSSADADTISFSVGGHRIRIEAPRDCRSSSCASISIPGVYESRRKRDDDTRNVVAAPPPAPPLAQVAPPPAPPPVQQSAPPPKPVVATAPVPAPLAVYKPASVTSQEAAPPPLPPLPPMEQVRPATSVTQPCTAPPADRPDEPARPAPPVLKVLHQEDSADSPLGDWQTESRGIVRIAECGRALCGYAIKEGESEKGEAILINMKPKSDQQWGGSVYSRDSGDTYYGTMRLRGPNTLRVEACAFSRFYCNGNNWTRITTKPMMTSRQMTTGPRT